MDIIDRATEFEHRKHKFITTSDRIIQGRTTMGKAPAVHFHTSVGGNKSAVLPNDR